MMDWCAMEDPIIIGSAAHTHTHTQTAASLKWRFHAIVTSYSRRVHFALLPTWLPCRRLRQVDTARCSVILPMVDSAFCCYACLYFDLNEWIQVKSKVKSFPEPQRAHGAALISVSLALSRTPAEAARPRIRGQCIAWYARLLPSFRWYSLTDPGGIARRVDVGTQ